MFDEMAKAKAIFWEEFQGAGMSHEIFDVLFDSSIEKLKRNLTSRRSRAAGACPKCGKPLIMGVFCETECGYYPPPA